MGQEGEPPAHPKTGLAPWPDLQLLRPRLQPCIRGLAAKMGARSAVSCLGRLSPFLARLPQPTPRRPWVPPATM